MKVARTVREGADGNVITTARMWITRASRLPHCEFCGVPHGTPAVSERTGVVYTICLAAAHLDHDPWNPEPRLAALCPSCHARYDYSWRERERRVALEQYQHRLWLDRWLLGSGKP